MDGNGNTTKPDVKTIKVPIPTFPPTAMVYSLDNGESISNTVAYVVQELERLLILSKTSVADKELNGNNESSAKQNAPVDIVSAAIMAKILKEREKERLTAKHCQTCSCSIISYDSKFCQTDEIQSINVSKTASLPLVRSERKSNFETTQILSRVTFVTLVRAFFSIFSVEILRNLVAITRPRGDRVKCGNVPVS